VLYVDLTEFADDEEFPTLEVTDDIPAVTRKRCNTMPGTFVVPDDITQDTYHISDG